MDRLQSVVPQEGKSATPTILIVPGLNNSDSDHWQTAWEHARPDCRRADLGQWTDPTPGQWISHLDHAICQIPGTVVIVAHSLGCIATALWNRQCRQDRRKRVMGALLVAPCDPEVIGAAPALRRFAPVPSVPLGFRSILVASANDPYASIPRVKAFAHLWGSEFVNIGNAGHINSRSGLGYWRYGQGLLETLLNGD
jgi:uncharacterized protein